MTVTPAPRSTPGASAGAVSGPVPGRTTTSARWGARAALRGAVGVAAVAALAVTTVAAGTAGAVGDSNLTDIRTGVHPGFDRVVLDFSGAAPAFGVTGKDALFNCGSGLPVSLPGTVEYVEIDAASAAHDDNGVPTYTGPRRVVTTMPSVTGYAITCDFEGRLQVAVGTKGQVSEIRTTALSNPGRIVVDVIR